MKKTLTYTGRCLAVLPVLLAAFTLPVVAQETTDTHVARSGKDIQYYQGSVHDLAWLQGSWKGAGLGENARRYGINLPVTP